MAKALRFLLFSAAAIVGGPFLAMLFEPLFSEVLAVLEIDLGQFAAPMVAVMAYLIAVEWFRIFAAGVLGSALVVWLHWLAIGYDRRHIEKFEEQKRTAAAKRVEGRQRITEKDKETLEMLTASLSRLVVRTSSATAHRSQMTRDQWQESFDESHALALTLNRKGNVYDHALGTIADSGRAVIQACEGMEYKFLLESVGIQYRLFQIEAFDLEADDVPPKS